MNNLIITTTENGEFFYYINYEYTRTNHKYGIKASSIFKKSNNIILRRLSSDKNSNNLNQEMMKIK